LPATAINDAQIVLNPVIDGGSMGFKNSTTVNITSSQKEVDTYYTLDGTDPSVFSTKYMAPFAITKSTVIKAVAYNAAGKASFITSAKFTRAVNDWSIKLNTLYETQYPAGGNDALIDGIRGTAEWRKGNWQAWQKTDMDVVIDLQAARTVSKVTVGLLQDVGAWIVMPGQVSVEISADGNTFMPFASVDKILAIDDKTPQAKKVLLEGKVVQTRYIRIRAKQYGKLPAWHEGAGGDTHIFCDEITME
jgi:hypothetical protein